MNETLKKILLGKDTLVIPDDADAESTEDDADQLIGSIEYSFASLGYSLSAKAIKTLKRLGKDRISAFYKSSVPLLQSAKGANVKHVVFYKNFPEGVLSMSEAELYLRACMHYLSVSMKDIEASDYVYMPDDIAKTPRLPFTDSLTPVVLSLIKEGNDTDRFFVEYAQDVLSSPVAMTEKQKSEIEAIRKEVAGADSKICPKRFQFKETLAYWVGLMVKDYGVAAVFSDSRGLVDFSSMTATDILRVYGIVSDGNATITTQNIKYASLPRSARRFIMGTLDEICKKFNSEGNDDLIEDEFGTHNFRWNCAFRQLHAGEYADEFPFVSAIVRDCRSNGGCVTIASTIDSIISEAVHNGLSCQEAIDKIVVVLSKKPGVFARRLDSLLRNRLFVGKERSICDGFFKVTDKVSLGVLIQLYDHFSARGDQALGDSMRFFTYEHNGMAITHAEADTRYPIPRMALADVLETIKVAIVKKELEHATPEGYNLSGKVYISQALSQYRLPTSARTASSSVKTLPRGSKIRFSELSESGKFIRVFTHWHNLKEGSGKDDSLQSARLFMYGGNRVDIDLSATMYDSGFKQIDCVSWNRIYRTDYAVHSGDVTDAPNGASEFIDIDLEKAKRKGVRYIAISNSSYLGVNWNKIPECFSGIMIRSGFGTNSGEIYEPTSVRYKFDLTQSSSSMNLAFAYDVENNEIIWIDSPFSGRRIASGATDEIADVICGALKKHLTMLDLINMASGKFGEITTDPKEADVVFGEMEESDVKDAKIVRPTDCEVFEKLFM